MFGLGHIQDRGEVLIQRMLILIAFCFGIHCLNIRTMETLIQIGVICEKTGLVRDDI